MSDFGFNAVHLHLLLNHFPIVLSVFGPAVLGYWLYRKEPKILHATLLIPIIAAIITVPVFFSWMEAIKTVSGIEWIDSHALVIHESMATITAWLIFFLWVISTIVFLLGKQNSEKNYMLGYYVIFVFSLVVFTSVLLTGYYGGSIRHTEIYLNNP